MDVWNAGDSTSNLIESVHADVNREGVGCTLLGGVKKGHAFDLMKINTIKLQEDLGIRPSYSSGQIFDNVSKSFKRKFSAQHNQLAREDTKIEVQNKKLRILHDHLLVKRQRQEELQKYGPSVTLDKAVRAAENSSVTFDKGVEKSKSFVGTGSGKVGLLLPSTLGDN